MLRVRVFPDRNVGKSGNLESRPGDLPQAVERGSFAPDTPEAAGWNKFGPQQRELPAWVITGRARRDDELIATLAYVLLSD